MTIQVQKFGKVLNARPAGREAFLAIRPSLPSHNVDAGSDRGKTEDIIIDFDGVEVLTPSFADEFVTPLTQLYPGRISFANTENITVRKTLAFLSEDWPKGTYQS
ncbi:STAS-like domain-containing protein [Candidatus Peregrinibacteria bacterium]|nr:STAS-like domain-containing protein [Candidatus Peregrinibacteria bacterium]MBI3815984.1 STAS-like domain-containing protein [Candidatus Peregrinibacteria bacterium]